MSISDEGGRRVTAADLRVAAPLAFWPEPALERLAAASSVAWHEAGETLAHAFEPPNEMWIVLEGCIEMTRTTVAGRRYLSDLMAPPQIAGLVPCLDGRGVLFNTVVRVRSRLIRCPREAFVREVEADGAISLGLLRLMCFRTRMEHDRTFISASDPHAGSVAKTILYLGRRPDLLNAGDRRLPMPVTYDDIADFLGLSVSAVTRVVKALIAAGAVKKQYRGLVIADAEALMRFIEAASPMNDNARAYLSLLPRG